MRQRLEMLEREVEYDEDTFEKAWEAPAEC